MKAEARNGIRYASLKDRILANVRAVPAPQWTGLLTPCWEWQGTLNARGYGHMSVRKPWRGKPWPFKVLVHRLVLTEFCGIPDIEIENSCHQCSYKPCCNPEHLLPDTSAGNREHYLTVELPAKKEAGR